MDVWAWVHETEEELRRAGHERLAEIVNQLPSLVSEGLHVQVEALTPEGVALARGIDHAWVEVYLRHWLAQSRILRRRDVTQGMDEVIRLLDFAHGEQTANCPQSICVSQDVCAAYAVLDGPGYGEERLAVSAETLARIDPSWPCFHCISSEYADALLDLGRFADAEEFCRAQISKARLEGDGDHDQMILSLIDALSRQDRHADAVALVETDPVKSMEPYQKRRFSLYASREYALLGRLDKALEVHPGDVVAELDAADFRHWIQAETALMKSQPERNDARLGRTLRDFFCTLRANGALYDQADVALTAARLALGRGSVAVATLHLDEAATVLPRLRNPEPIAAMLEQLRARLPEPAVGESEAVALESLGDDAERNFEVLQPAQRASPDNEAVTLALCRAYRDLGFIEHAHRELKRFVLSHPDSTTAFEELMRALVIAGDEAELVAMTRAVPEKLRAKALFYLGRLHVRRHSWPEAERAFEESDRCEPGVRSVKSNLSIVYREVGRCEESLALLDALAEDETDRSDDWDRMVVATLLGRHDKVRESARRIGFTFDGEGPIDDWYAYCDVRIKDTVGREVSYRCWRINPVVGRVLEIPRPGAPGRYLDEVLFEPSALNPRPEPPKDPDNDDYVPEFRAVKVLKTGGYRTYDLDGVYPGEAAVDALAAELKKLRVVLSVRSSETYQLRVREGEPTVRGLYAFLAAPTDVPTSEVCRALIAGVSAWTEPVTFRGLLEELGQSEELATQQRIAEQLKL